MVNSVDLDEVAHNEYKCLQIQLFSSLVLKELRRNCFYCSFSFAVQFKFHAMQTAKFIEKNYFGTGVIKLVRCIPMFNYLIHREVMRSRRKKINRYAW